MTTRETTALLPLDDIGLNLSFSDRAMVMAYGAVQWLWLLRSLHGGRKADKAALLRHLDLPLDSLPNLGSWKADTHFLWHIVKAIEQLRPAQVVELGCGASSFVIARALQLNGGGRCISYDQHKEFAAITQEWIVENDISADIRHAPLGPSPDGWPGHWCQLSDVPAEIDLLIVDGPPWAIPRTFAARRPACSRASVRAEWCCSTMPQDWASGWLRVGGGRSITTCALCSTATAQKARWSGASSLTDIDVPDFLRGRPGRNDLRSHQITDDIKRCPAHVEKAVHSQYQA